MQIIAVELKNFCQHEDRRVEFSPGLNAIVGANGAGKSNILNAVGFAITGDIATEGAKNDNIRQQAPKTAKSYVRVTFQHGDATVIVRRNLRPLTPNAELTINGQLVATGKDPVDAELERLLGVPRDVISTMVIVGHSELFGFLQQTQAARLSQFQKLFRLERATKLYDGIGKYLSQTAVPVVTEASADLQVQLAVCEEELQTVTQQLAETMRPPEIQTAIDQCSAVLLANTQAQQLATQLSGWRAQLQHMQQCVAQDKVTLAEAQQRQAELQEQYDKIDLGAASGAISSWSVYVSAKTAAEFSAERVRRAEEVLQTAYGNQRASNSADPNLLPYAMLEEARQHRDELRRMIPPVLLRASLQQGHDCPTCGASAGDVAHRSEEAAELATKLQTELGQLEAKLQNSERQYTAERETAEDVKRAAQELAKAKEAMQAIPEAPTVISKEVAEQILGLARGLESKLRSGAAEIAGLASQVSGSEGRILQMEQQAAQYTATLMSMVQPTPQEVTSAQEDLQSWQQVMVVARGCELKQAAAAERVASVRQRLQAAVVAERQTAHVVNFRRQLEIVRGIFHKEAAPALVIQSNLNSLQAEINNQLSLFDADYRVQVADGASFTAAFEGGIVQPVQRLSYGQKVALAFAFRLALNRTVIPQVNGLYLDEPTAYLDERRIDAFAPVFEQLRRAATSTGLQCVIVTHERRLAPLFDKVIEV